MQAVRNVVQVRRVPGAESIVAVAPSAKLQAVLTARAQQPHVKRDFALYLPGLLSSVIAMLFRWRLCPDGDLVS